MKKRYILILLFILILSACATKPTFYSDEEVKQYANDVFGNVTYIDKDGNDEDGYIYTFKDNTIEFHVKSFSYKDSIDGSTTIFYEKDISDDYLESVVSYYKNDIVSIFNKYGIPYYISDTFIAAYINSLDEMDQVYNVYKDINNLLDLDYDYSKTDISMYSKYLGIDVYMKPNQSYIDTYGNKEWKKNGSLGRLCFKGNGKETLSKEACCTRIEKGIVTYVINHDDNKYTITDEQRNKYGE